MLLVLGGATAAAATSVAIATVPVALEINSSPPAVVAGGVWTWMAGPRNGAAPTTGNAPGARCCAHTWHVGGSVWLFGGYGYDNNGTQAYLSDLWSFNIASRAWTYVLQKAILPSPCTYPLATVQISTQYQSGVFIATSARWPNPGCTALF